MAVTPEACDRSTVRCVLLLIGYLVVTTFFVLVLEPGLTPPGFTGRGAWAMPLVLLGAFHAGKWSRCGALFLVFGCVATLPLFLSYFGDHRLMFRLDSPEKANAAVAAWTAFIVAIGLLARLSASIRWRWKSQVPAGPPRCDTCGYDLRASRERCPECGTRIEPAKASAASSETQRLVVVGVLYASVLLLLRPHPGAASSAAAPAPTRQWFLIVQDGPEGPRPIFTWPTENQTPQMSILDQVLLPVDDQAASGE